MDFRVYSRLFLTYLLSVLIQIMVFHNINIGTLGITPLFYVLFILMMPYEVPAWFQLVLGFVLGWTMDVFCDTPGLHTSATVLMAYSRIKILEAISPRDGYETGMHPYLMEMGIHWFLKYSVSLIFIHHTAYFMLDSFGFDNFSRTLLKIVLTGLCTELFIIFSQYIAYRK